MFLFILLFFLRVENITGHNSSKPIWIDIALTKSVHVFVFVLMIPQSGGGNCRDDILCLKSPILLAAWFHVDFKASLNCERAQSDTED